MVDNVIKLDLVARICEKNIAGSGGKFGAGYLHKPCGRSHEKTENNSYTGDQMLEAWKYSRGACTLDQRKLGDDGADDNIRR